MNDKLDAKNEAIKKAKKALYNIKDSLNKILVNLDSKDEKKQRDAALLTHGICRMLSDNDLINQYISISLKEATEEYQKEKELKKVH